MAYREKVAWIGFITWLVGGGLYFIMLTRTLASGGSRIDDVPNPFITCVAISLILTAWLERRTSRRERAQADERERLIEMRSSEIAFRTLMTLLAVVAGAALIFDGVLKGVALTDPGYTIFHALFLLMILVGLVRFAAQIVLFRRSHV